MSTRVLPTVVKMSGGGAVLAVFAYMLLIQDPMLVYLTLIFFTGALFPDWWFVLAATAVYGMFRIAVKHDPVTGDASTFVSAVGEGVTASVNWSASVVALSSMRPLLKALLSFDFRAVLPSLEHLLPLTGLMFFKNAIESQMENGIIDRITHVIQQAKDFMRMVRTWLA